MYWKDSETAPSFYASHYRGNLAYPHNLVTSFHWRCNHIQSGYKLIDLDLEQQFEVLIGTIRTIRNLRAEADIKPG